MKKLTRAEQVQKFISENEFLIYELDLRQMNHGKSYVYNWEAYKILVNKFKEELFTKCWRKTMTYKVRTSMLTNMIVTCKWSIGTSRSSIGHVSFEFYKYELRPVVNEVKSN